MAKRGSGKAKGSDWERTLAKTLSKWWTQDDKEGVRDDIFWRSAGSGNMATLRHKSGKRAVLHCGDLAAIDPIGQPLLDLVTIELKRGYNHVTIHDLLDKNERKKEIPVSSYEEWFLKAHRASLSAQSEGWLLIHQRDRREALVFVSHSVWHKLLQTRLHLLEDERPLLSLQLQLEDKWEIVHFVTLKEWIKVVKPEWVKSLVHQLKRA